jgi:tetratricopeptide (TPR) repeat protein
MWRRLFEIETYQFSQLSITRIRFETGRAFARVAAARTTVNTQNNAVRQTEMRVEYSFVKEDGQWKFFNETPATMGLFNELAQAKTDAERNALLDGEPTLVTRELLFQLSSQSDFAYTSASYDRAMNLLAAARRVAERIDDKKEQANAWQNIGIIHFVKLRHPAALDAYQKALALNLKLDRQSEAARMLTSIGLVHSAMGKQPLALEYFQRGLAIHERLNERSEASQTLDNIGNLFYERGDTATAADYFRKSAAHLESGRATRTLVSRLMKLAKTEYEQGNNPAAIENYTRALAKMDEAGEKDARGYALHKMLNREEWRHPYFWAGFHVLGDAR